MESFQHNQVKQCIGAALSAIGKRENAGLYFMDGFRVNMPQSHVEFEPDGCFVRYASLRPLKANQPPKVVFRHGKKQTFIGLNGIPDLVVEIASPSRLEADYDVKRNDYARLGVPEFWLLMPRGPSYFLTIFRLCRRPFAYFSTASSPSRRRRLRPERLEADHSAWCFSPTFRRFFRLTCLATPDHRLCTYELRQREVGGI